MNDFETPNTDTVTGLDGRPPPIRHLDEGDRRTALTDEQVRYTRACIRLRVSFIRGRAELMKGPDEEGQG